MTTQLKALPLPSGYIGEILQELHGKFVASYPLPGNAAFRCFQYDPARRRFSIDWGLLLLVLPGLLAILSTVWVFESQRSKHQPFGHNNSERRKPDLSIAN